MKRMIAAATAIATFGVLAGCSCGSAPCSKTTVAYTPVAHDECTTVAYSEKAVLPGLPSVEAGECYAQVFVPPVTRTCSERVLVRAAYEKTEIIPAQYEWVEEKVCVKEASKRLVEEPVAFKTETRTIEVEPSHTAWVAKDSLDCKTDNGEKIAASPIFCLTNFPPVTKTVQTQAIDKCATVREIEEPAEYQTVKRQRVSHAAEVRRTTVPAEYEDISKTVVVSPGRIEWRKAVCEINGNPAAINRVKNALAMNGYDAGALNGEMNKEFWAAVKQFQQDQGIGVGALTCETLEKLGVNCSGKGIDMAART